MLRNYLISALRNLYKYKAFSLINIFGLAVGIASFILISLYVYHELRFDKFNKKADRIYRVVENLRTENELLLQSTSSPPMGPAMARDFPEVENYVRIVQDNVLVRKGDMAIYENDCYLADSTIFDVFTFPLIKGDKKTALTKPKTAVLTETTARKYFGDQNPVGQSLEIDGELYEVTGIMADVPENAHFTFDMLFSFSTWSSENKSAEQQAWFWNSFHTYLLLRDDSQAINKVRAKMKDFIERNIEKGGMNYETLPLQPLTSLYLATPRSWENGKRGNLNNLYILSIIAVFIILIACFNYVNLATARATRRLKEVGLRKVLGALRRTLILQFVGESIIVSTVATILGFLVAWLSLPAFNSLVDSQLSFDLLPHPYLLWAALAGIALLLGLFSGAYPALIISGFQPLQVFRPNLGGVFSHRNFRKVLVAAQFVISIALVAGTLLVYDQLHLVKNQDLGFNKEATLLIRFHGQEAVRIHIETIKQELKKVPGVVSATASHTVPGESTTNLFSMVEVEGGKMSPTNINTDFIDADFIPAYGIQMISGRNFISGSRADDTTAFIINEAAMKAFGWTPENAIGRKVEQRKKGTIIGVTKAYNYRSLHYEVEPLLLTIDPYPFTTISLKLHSNDIPAAVKAIGNRWSELSDGMPYEYSFLDENYDRLYEADSQLGSVATIFSTLAIFVGCLGLLGLTSFSVERRVKEIGIRKVLGATPGSVILLISREFVWLIGVAFVIATPFTYFLITRWLQNFTNKIQIGLFDFFVAGTVVLAIAWLTISYLSFRAAATNPSQALRTE